LLIRDKAQERDEEMEMLIIRILVPKRPLLTQANYDKKRLSSCRYPNTILSDRAFWSGVVVLALSLRIVFGYLQELSLFLS
jgi:hypothetical protein